EAQRAERASVARRLLAAGRLCQVRMADRDALDRFQWCIDNWEAVAAEVAAELGISRARASSQMNYGLELLERLPKLGAAMAAGLVDFRVIAVVVFRTGLITDPHVLEAIDTTLAAVAPGWNALSRNRVMELVDWRVRALDPAAERVARDRDEDRHVEINPSHNGLAQFWGAVRATDAAVLDRRLDQLAGSVCGEDSRTKEQRRADALAALAAGQSAMVCDCGSAQCPAAGVDAAPAQVVIHVVAEQATVAGESTTPGYLPGFGALSAETVRDLATRAHLRPLTPAQEFTAEPQYRPSTKLAEFIRARDLWCRFPGCDVAAEFCDLDHSIPWASGGPTHPSNIHLKCRPHHLLKTFWCGENGWAEQHHPDGTIVVTSPSGRTYTTTPGGALFFPQLAAPTETLTPETLTPRVPPPGNSPGRTLMMPTRKRSRAAERAARIDSERGLNEARWAADPPPF
ncbi:MAG: DUF222 domain-containing protein, partial [Mycobacterium sp.]